MSNTDVLIIGGGVIGTACAEYLTQRGVTVTLLERNQIGMGCSYGNCGLIVPSHSLPLPMPGMLAQAGRWLLKADSPFYIKPRLSWELLCWLARFARSSNQVHLQHAASALGQLSSRSLELYGQMAADNGTFMGYVRKGTLYVYRTQPGLEHAVHEMGMVCKHGAKGELLNSTELRALEPSITGKVVGATYFHDEAHVEPLAVVQTFGSRAEQRGARVIGGAEVINWHTKRGRIDAVDTTRGRFGAETIILATGSWTPSLVRTLQLKVPIQAGKGYAVIVEPFSPVPKIPSLLGEVKVCVTPRQGSVRLAGTMELAGMDESITTARVDAIVRGAREFYTQMPAQPVVREVWRGLRPCTPDGLPMIGRTDRWDNLILAAGHAMLGLTLAAATGEMVADMVTNQNPCVDPTPFSPARFA